MLELNIDIPHFRIIFLGIISFLLFMTSFLIISKVLKKNIYVSHDPWKYIILSPFCLILFMFLYLHSDFIVSTNHEQKMIENQNLTYDMFSIRNNSKLDKEFIHLFIDNKTKSVNIADYQILDLQITGNENTLNIYSCKEIDTYLNVIQNTHTYNGYEFVVTPEFYQEHRDLVTKIITHLEKGKKYDNK